MAVSGRRSPADSSASVRAGQAGRGGQAGRVPAEREPAGAPPRRGIELSDDPLGDSDHPELEPATASARANLAPGATVDLLEFSGSRGRTVLLEEVVLGSAANAIATVTVNGQQAVALVPGGEATIDFGGAKLPYGGHVRVRLQDASGSSNIVIASVIAREV
jgi:hypothetical protein